MLQVELLLLDHTVCMYYIYVAKLPTIGIHQGQTQKHAGLS